MSCVHYKYQEEKDSRYLFLNTLRPMEKLLEITISCLKRKAGMGPQGSKISYYLWQMEKTVNVYLHVTITCSDYSKSGHIVCACVLMYRYEECQMKAILPKKEQSRDTDIQRYVYINFYLPHKGANRKQ